MRFSELPAGRLRLAINLYPPFLFAGIRVTEISADHRRVRVTLKLRPWNRNLVGTQFGGSLFAMSDPWFMLILMKRLGPGYIVRDKAAAIDFVAPGRGHVHATFELSDGQIAAFQAATDAQGKHLEWFETEIVDDAGAVVARVRRQLYARRKQR